MYSPARRRVLILVTLASAAVGIYLLWPVAMHVAAKAILNAHAIELTDLSKTAPDFTLKNAAGKRLSLSDYKGKVVVLNFWATWCGPCKVEIPWFIEFQKKYAGQGFTVLGVSMDEEGWNVVNPYASKMEINYPIVVGNEEVNMHYGGIEALPTTFVIDRHGKVAYVHAGLISKGEYEKEITHLLEGGLPRDH
jgi:cytochrome c biogenesis protein CcmG/thiol:disulfide interchange protein DsbE